jgi:hypothetical protein
MRYPLPLRERVVPACPDLVTVCAFTNPQRTEAICLRLGRRGNTLISGVVAALVQRLRLEATLSTFAVEGSAGRRRVMGQASPDSKPGAARPLL